MWSLARSCASAHPLVFEHFWEFSVAVVLDVLVRLIDGLTSQEGSVKHGQECARCRALIQWTRTLSPFHTVFLTASQTSQIAHSYRLWRKSYPERQGGSPGVRKKELVGRWSLAGVFGPATALAFFLAALITSTTSSSVAFSDPLFLVNAARAPVATQRPTHQAQQTCLVGWVSTV